MFGCAACGRLGSTRLCDPCRRGLTAAPASVTTHGLLVAAAHRHEGTARRLVHVLKYTGSPQAAGVLGDGMAAVVPASATALVPVRRARLRRWRYGGDPAALLSEAVARATGLPVADVLSPDWWWGHHAGRQRHRRSAPHWRSRGRGAEGWVLVDDVLTTGSTLAAAAACLGGIATSCLVATAAGRVSPEGGTASVPSSWEVAWQVAGGPSRGPRRRAPS